MNQTSLSSLPSYLPPISQGGISDELGLLEQDFSSQKNDQKIKMEQKFKKWMGSSLKYQKKMEKLIKLVVKKNSGPFLAKLFQKAINFVTAPLNLVQNSLLKFIPQKLRQPFSILFSMASILIPPAAPLSLLVHSQKLLMLIQMGAQMAAQGLGQAHTWMQSKILFKKKDTEMEIAKTKLIEAGQEKNFTTEQTTMMKKNKQLTHISEIISTILENKGGL